VKLNIRLAGLSPATEYELRVTEFGNILSDCSMAGDQFNPLAPEPFTYYSWGRLMTVTPESDGRGEIESFTSDASGDVEMNDVELQQNLSGEDTLIGRGIVLYEKDDDKAIMCGVIGHGLPEADIVNLNG